MLLMKAGLQEHPGVGAVLAELWGHFDVLEMVKRDIRQRLSFEFKELVSNVKQEMVGKGEDANVMQFCHLGVWRDNMAILEGRKPREPRAATGGPSLGKDEPSNVQRSLEELIIPVFELVRLTGYALERTSGASIHHSFANADRRPDITFYVGGELVGIVELKDSLHLREGEQQAVGYGTVLKLASSYPFVPIVAETERISLSVAYPGHVKDEHGEVVPGIATLSFSHARENESVVAVFAALMVARLEVLRDSGQGRYLSPFFSLGYCKTAAEMGDEFEKSKELKGLKFPPEYRDVLVVQSGAGRCPFVVDVRGCGMSPEVGSDLWIVRTAKGESRMPRVYEFGKFVCDITTGMRFLHLLGMAHNDIRFPNVVLSRAGNWQLIDLENGVSLTRESQRGDYRDLAKLMTFYWEQVASNADLASVYFAFSHLDGSYLADYQIPAGLSGASGAV
jgi:hypothetical protein